jgi:hypothetical protein
MRLQAVLGMHPQDGWAGHSEGGQSQQDARHERNDGRAKCHSRPLGVCLTITVRRRAAFACTALRIRGVANLSRLRQLLLLRDETLGGLRLGKSGGVVLIHHD